MPFDIDALDVIYAEDEEAFRMITTPVLTFAGIDEGNIHIAENGHEALECLKGPMQARPDRPLLMLMDVRMPLMDGHTCAAEVKALADAKSLKRVPFVVIYTAGIDKVSKEDSDQNSAVKISMPKPLDKKQLESVIDSLKKWWESSAAARSCVVDIPPMDPSVFDIIVANDEPICSMALIATLNLAGVDDENVLQADTSDEIDETVASVASDGGRPLLLFLGNESWLTLVNEAITKSGKKVFIVWSSVDTDSKLVTQKGFNGYLPRSYDKKYIIENVLQPCHQWFHSG